MSAHINGTFRTARFFDLETKTLQGSQGPYEAHSLLFVVASTRNRKENVYENGVLKLDAQGQPVKERKSDFLLCKATGELAKTIDKHVKSFRNEAGQEKLNSRFLFISGTLETYEKERKVDINKPVNIGGQIYNVAFSEMIPDTKTIIRIDEFEFLDSKPNDQEVIVTAVDAGTPAVAPVQAVPVGAAPVAPVQAAVPAPQVSVAVPAAPAVPVAPTAPVAPAAPQAPFQTALPNLPEAPSELLSEDMAYTPVSQFEGIVVLNGVTYRVKLTAAGKVDVCPF